MKLQKAFNDAIPDDVSDRTWEHVKFIPNFNRSPLDKIFIKVHEDFFIELVFPI
jgi:hypothetical protein